jgi:hypothetical protein
MPPTAEPVQPAGLASVDAVRPDQTNASRACRWCCDQVSVRALRCPHCRSWLSDEGRQQALREFLASVGLRSVDVGQSGVWGLTIPGAILLVIFAWFLARGLFTILGSQPALLQVVIGTIGIVVVLALCRERTRS